MSLVNDNIEYFSKGEIKIAGQTYDQDLIIMPNRILHNWRRTNPNALHINDFQAVISERPAYLIIGNGHDNNLQLDDQTKQRLYDLGFEVFVARTRTAIKKYNRSCKDRKTIGMFHIY